MSIIKKASAVWTGTLKEGKGEISTESGALKSQPYGFQTRFEDKAGTNPEELIGAAHAGCFSMAFSNELGKAGFTAEKIETSAAVHLEKSEGGFSVTKVELKTTAQVPGADEKDVRAAADTAKKHCPISKLLNADITLDLKVTTS